VLTEVVAKVTALAPEGKPVRLAVVTFTPTQREYVKRNDFGLFLTEELISELKKNTAAVRLFERSRLEVITEENALTLSGLINQETAAKIGELAPIDRILTGTYTRLGDAVGINVRLLDVVSGEILFTINIRAAFDANIASLFVLEEERSTLVEAAEKEPADPCAPVNRELRALMVDLSTQDKVHALVQKAKRVPFDTLCGKIHYRILGRFARYDLQDPSYTRFLLSTLDDVKVPTSDHRGIEILRYFHGLGPLSDEVWEAGFALARRVGNDWLNVYLGPLFHTRGEISDAYMQKQYRRIDKYLALALDGRIGLPVSVSTNFAFRELIGALGPRFEKTDKRPILYCYETYWDRLPKGAFRMHDKYLGWVYNHEDDPARKMKLLEFMCRNFNEAPVNEELAKKLYEFTRSLWLGSENGRLSQDEAKLAGQHYERLLELCRPKLIRAIVETDLAKDNERLVRFCLATDLHIPGVVPTVDSLRNQLFADHINHQRKAAEMLKLMGEKAKPAEQDVIALLRRSSRLRGMGTTNLLWDLVGILGNIRTTDKEALRMMFEQLTSSRHSVADSVQVAFARIGHRAVPLLKKELDRKSVV